MVPDHLTPPVGDQSRDDEAPAEEAGASARPPPNRVEPPESDASVDYGICWLDLNGRVTRWTKACERLFQRNRSDAVGEHFRALFTEDDKGAGLPEVALIEARRSGSWDDVGWKVTSGGDRFWAATSVTRVSTPNGIDIGHMVVIRDLHPFAEEEPLAPDATRLVSLGRVATEVSHDVSNILAAIRGFAGLLERKLPSGGSSHQVWYELVKACDRGSELTKRVLNVAREASEEAGVVSVAEVARDIEPLLRQVLPNRIVLTLSLEDGLPPVRGVSNDIELALLNLVVNARDAIDGEGVIAVSVGRERSGTQRDRIVVAVRDSGSGMTEEVRERVFERFFTTKSGGEGTGIGMSVVRDSVRAAGGSIEIESKPDRGTIVRLLLKPAVESRHIEGEQAEAREERAPEGPPEVLVCCASEILCECAADLLRREGFSVTKAHSAAGARRARGERTGGFDAVIVDLLLPDATGPELVAGLNSDAGSPTTIYVSDRTERAAEVLDGVGLTDRVLFAPFSPEELVDTVQRLTSRSDDRASAVH